MVVIITSKDDAAPELFRNSPPTDNADKITGSFFDKRSFNLTTRPRWVTNYPAGREGGFKQHTGSFDGNMPVLLHLTGTTRFDDLDLWRRIASGTVFFLTSDTDSNLDGNYVVTGALRPVYIPRFRRIELNMSWEKHNNG